VFYLLSSRSDALDFAGHDGSVAQVYVMLIATTPPTGRALLWVLAPSAALSQEPRRWIAASGKGVGTLPLRAPLTGISVRQLGTGINLGPRLRRGRGGASRWSR
jgi:hypothetical protein